MVFILLMNKFGRLTNSDSGTGGKDELRSGSAGVEMNNVKSACIAAPAPQNQTSADNSDKKYHTEKETLYNNVLSDERFPDLIYISKKNTFLILLPKA